MHIDTALEELSGIKMTPPSRNIIFEPNYRQSINSNYKYKIYNVKYIK